MGRGLDLVARRSDGTEFPVEISLSYIETEEGLWALAFVTDITERQVMERAARQADRLAALGRLSAGIAHEVNNPIGIISSRIEIMLLDAEAQPLPGTVTEDLKVLHRHEVESRRGSPVTEEPRLHVLLGQGFLEEGVVVEIDLADRQVVGGPPVGIHKGSFLSVSAFAMIVSSGPGFFPGRSRISRRATRGDAPEWSCCRRGHPP
jgi:hypothetical protein